MYESNSHKSKEAKTKPRLKPVVKGNTSVKKKSDMRRFLNVFLPEDIGSMKDYIFMDVIIPLIKDGIEDAVHTFLRGGGSNRRRTRYDRVSTGASKVSYASGASYTNYNKPKTVFDYDDIYFDTRDDAEMVLTTLEAALEQYDSVSVLDLYDLAERSCDNHAAQKYGWTDLSSAKVVRTVDGYTIRLPRAIPL